MLNLGPAWLSKEAYGLFNDNVIEIPFKDWESPPGLGICPLGVIFTVCSSIASWLALNEDHVVVSMALCHLMHALCIVWSDSVSAKTLGLCRQEMGCQTGLRIAEMQQRQGLYMPGGVRVETLHQCESGDSSLLWHT